jgi:regulatory protein
MCYYEKKPILPIMDPSDQDIWAKALALIQKRMMSRSDLKRKLLERFKDPDAVERVLREMERVCLLNDRRYAESYLSHLIQRPIGRLKIKVNAHHQGLDWNLVDGLLMDLGYDEIEHAKRSLEEKQPYLKENDARKRRQKLIAHLKYRGFTDRSIDSALREFQ